MNKKEALQAFHCLRKTPFGPVGVIWSVYRGRPKIWRVLISKSGVSAKHLVRTSFPDSVFSSCSEVDAVANKILAFLNGDNIRFSLDINRLDLCSKFQQKVLRAEHGIPRGRVSTYRRIAKHLGNDNAARAVGGALANNPFPIIIPCHRAIRSNGELGGFQGGLRMKKALLEHEGVSISDEGKVLKTSIYY